MATATDTAPARPVPSPFLGLGGGEGPHHRGWWAAALVALAVGGPAAAGDWKITPRAYVSESYTDNVSLAPAGSARDDLVTNATAGISAHGKGRRLTLDLDYSVVQILHADASASDSTNQQWQVQGEAEVLKHTGFLEFRTTMSQESLSNTGRVSDSLINSGDRRDVLTMSVSPVLRHRFGSLASSEARLTYDRVMNDSGSGTTTSESFGGKGDVHSGNRFSRLPWSLAASLRQVDNTDDTTDTFASVDGQLSYVVSRRWSADLGGGIESNDYASGANSTGGGYWRAGATWTPSARTRISGGYEDHYYGGSGYLDLSHRSRRTRWTASYHESVTTSRQLQLERVLVPLVDRFGQPIADPVTGKPILLPVDFVVPTNEVILNRTFNGAVEVTGRRTTATLSAFRSMRTFQVTDDEETVTGAALRVTRTLSGRLSANGGLAWQATDGRSGTGTETRWTADAGMSYAVGPSVSGAVTYRYTTQNDDAGVSDFSENRVMASLNVLF